MIINVDILEAPLFVCGPGHFSHGYSPYGNIPSKNRYIATTNFSTTIEPNPLDGSETNTGQFK